MNALRYLFLFLLFFLLSCETEPKVTEGFLESGGASIYYKTIGKGEPLLVLHGGPGFDHQILMPYIGRLGRHYKVIQYDQRGSGRSICPIDSASINIDTFIEDIEVIRKKFKIERINLAGVSWGGILAIFYSVKYPGNLKSLILFSTSASLELLYKMYPAMNNQRTAEDAKLLKTISTSDGFKNNDPIILEKFYKIFCKSQFADQTLAAKINMTLSESTAKNMSGINRHIMASIGHFDLHDSLKVIKCPTLIMHGKKDPLPVEAAQKIHAMVRNSELTIFDKSGHWIFIEEEDKFIKTVKSFLSKVAN